MIEGYQIEHVRRAHQAWRSANNDPYGSGPDHPLSGGEARELLVRAAHLLTSDRSPGPSDADAVLLTKRLPIAGMLRRGTRPRPLRERDRRRAARAATASPSLRLRRFFLLEGGGLARTGARQSASVEPTISAAET